MNSYGNLALFLVGAFAFLSVIKADSCPAPLPSGDGWIYDSIDLPGDCPNITFISNIDLTSAPGYNYRIFGTSNGSAFGCSGDCITSYIARYSDSLYNTEASCRRGCQSWSSTQLGSGLLSLDPTLPGRFNVDSNGSVRQIYYLDAQLNRFRISYACVLTETGEKRETVNVLSSYPFAPKILEKRILAALERNGVDLSKVEAISQYKTCPYNAY